MTKKEAVTIYHGDCRDAMQAMQANSVDSIVCDPPYGLSFMGRDWDHGVPGAAFWVEALRVAKPGTHLLAFGGTRTFHRLAVAIEDAGWEIRDTVMWVYGSGFPKSLDVGKAIDKANGRRFEDRYALGRHIRERREAEGLSTSDVNGWFGYRDGCQHWERQDASGARVPTLADWHVLRDRLGLSDEWAELIERIEAEREVVGQRTTGIGTGGGSTPIMGDSENRDITAPATDAAKQWDGWGTALKPAYEPIIVARKPLIGTVAANVLEHGTGGLNIDGCRVGTTDTYSYPNGPGGKSHHYSSDKRSSEVRPNATESNPLGRWPANLIHDGSNEVVGLFPDKAGGGHWSKTKVTGCGKFGGGKSEYFGQGEKDGFGSAARFFYCAKTSKRERGEGNNHPTVKPIALMRYLCRLVTPPGGIVLDPFMGSGSTGKAARLEGFRFVGCELDAEYCEIARARILAPVPDVDDEPLLAMMQKGGDV